jgi:hypothetical protein
MALFPTLEAPASPQSRFDRRVGLNGESAEADVPDGQHPASIKGNPSGRNPPVDLESRRTSTRGERKMNTGIVEDFLHDETSTTYRRLVQSLSAYAAVIIRDLRA